MDSQRFDSLVKSVARGANRRTVLKGLLGLGAGAAIAAPVLNTETDAARRPTPTPKPPKCPQGQEWNGYECHCIAGGTCGSDCCHIGTECCDGACCFGHCYGEELCCSWDNWCAATEECCPDGATCCGEQGCVVIEEGDCGCDGSCPDGFECCGGECCASGYCARDETVETCCAIGVCGNECLAHDHLACCDGEPYETGETGCCDGQLYSLFTSGCCDGQVYSLFFDVCCGDGVHSGECCEDIECGPCGNCLDHVCGEPIC